MGFLLDNLNRVLGKREREWHRVVNAFRLKYPDVDICTLYLDMPGHDPYNVDLEKLMRLGPPVLLNRYPPAAFMVWRIGKEGPTVGGRSPRPEGSYVVQLFSSLHHAEKARQGRLRGPDKVVAATALAGTNNRHAISWWGGFDYNAPAGELSASQSFSEMVVREDRQLFLDVGKRREWH